MRGCGVSMHRAGVWPNVIQRPFGIVNAEDNPKAIFISAFDTHPLAADIAFTVKGRFGINFDLKFFENLQRQNTPKYGSDREVPTIFSKVSEIETNRIGGTSIRKCGQPNSSH